MSRALFSRSPDLKRLLDEGYFVQQGGHLVMRQVPYVDAHRDVRIGTLISSLTLAGDATRTPDTHVVHWDGDGLENDFRRRDRLASSVGGQLGTEMPVAPLDRPRQGD